MGCRRIVLAPAFLSLLAGCNQDGLTSAEASQALDESSVESQASALTTTPIEISTNFTIGSGLENAATQLRAFLTSELPCAQISLSGATVTTQWGAAGGTCSYEGMAYSGTSTVTISQNDPGTVEVDHTWTNFSNGKVEVTGTAQVTWSSTDATRHVVHQLSWTRLSDGHAGTGTGDRTETLVSPSEGLLGGVSINGTRHWSAESGQWNLTITGVEVRVQDPVPESGAYQLTTPESKSVALSFERLGAASIQVTVSGPKESFSFVVLETGAVSGG